MTPDNLSTLCRQRYNAVSDNFFSATELYNLIWQAEQELAIRTLCIKSTQTTSTVASQHEYAKPTNCISIKRVTWNGQFLTPIEFQEDDILTANNQATSQTGTPLYYYEWGTSLFLRPTPGTVQTLKVFFYARPQEVDANTTLEIPEEYHMMMVDFMLFHMAAKDGNTALSAYYKGLWDQSVEKVMRWEKRKLRGNAQAAVKNMDGWIDTADIL